jgi:lysophospholipase L1-like esterase
VALSSLVGKLRAHADDITLGIVGDSTGNETDEWVTLLLDALGNAYPERTVDTCYWIDATQSLSGFTTIQTGAPPLEVIGLDRFGRVAAEIRSSVPDIGQAWTTDFGTGAGEWTLDGTDAVRTAVAAAGILNLLPLGRSGRMKATIDATISSVGGAASRNFRFGFWIDASNYLFAQVVVSTAGAVSYNIVKRIAGSNTVIATGVTTPFPGSTAANTISMSLTLDGTTVSAVIGAGSVAGTISAGEATTLGSATRFMMNSDVASGDKLHSVQVEQLSTPTAPRLRMYNGSFPGSILAYHEARVASMFPVPLDVLLVCSSHNYGDDTPAEYRAALDSFIAAFRAEQPEAGVALVSQNPRFPPAYNGTDHARRLAALPGYAAAKSLGYIPVYEAWIALPDRGPTLVDADGIHPTKGAVGTGSAFWADTVFDYLEAL